MATNIVVENKLAKQTIMIEKFFNIKAVFIFQGLLILFWKIINVFYSPKSWMSEQYPYIPYLQMIKRKSSI